MKQKHYVFNNLYPIKIYAPPRFKSQDLTFRIKIRNRFVIK